MNIISVAVSTKKYTCTFVMSVLYSLPLANMFETAHMDNRILEIRAKM